MAEVKMDTKGLRCPQPVLKLTAKMAELKPGDIVEIVGDCATFEEDLRKWCTRMKKTLLAVNKDGDCISIQIQF